MFQVSPDGSVKGGIQVAGSNNQANPNGLNLSTNFAQSINFDKKPNGQSSNQNAGSVGVDAALNIPALKNAQNLAKNKKGN